MELFYITYQAIPSTTAHGVHTFSLIKNFSKQNTDLTLVYPLRDKTSSDDINVIKEKFDLSENFKIQPTKHYLPFGTVKVFRRFIYLFSHILWSFFVSKKYKNKNNFFTLSDWVFYFLSRHKKNIIFECHNLTSIRIRLIKKSLKLNKQSKVIFINDLIREDSGLRRGPQVYVLESGYDDDIFNVSPKNNKKQKIVFSGNLLRFEKDRGVKKILDYFCNSSLSKNLELHIVGGPNEYVEQLRNLTPSKDGPESVIFYGHVNRKKVAEVLSQCDIGIMVNNNTTHSERHTSPLKYFEYLGSGLKVVATDVEAHRILPFNQHIQFFALDDIDSFEKAINTALSSTNELDSKDLIKLTNKYRVEQLINLLKARPEGLEPSTP